MISRSVKSPSVVTWEKSLGISASRLTTVASSRASFRVKRCFLSGVMMHHSKSCT